MQDVCVKCRRLKPKTRHHVLPRRFFGHSENSPCLLICRTCHSELEKEIPEKELQTIEFYWEVIFIFLKTNRVRIIEWSGSRSYVVRRQNGKADLQPVSEIIREIVDKLPRQEIPRTSLLCDNTRALQEA